MIVALVAAVFMYHHVSPTVQPGRYTRALTIMPREFSEQLGWLRARGCAIVHASTIVDDARDGVLAPCEVALTFDDGYADAAAYVAPLLTQAGATATFFISTGEVGSRGHLTVAQIRMLDDLGMELAAHTVHHVDLVQATAVARDAEIAMSASMLTRWTGRPVVDFAYPSGRYNLAVERSVASAGLRRAFTTVPGVISGSTIRDMFALPRYRMNRGSGLALLKAVLGNGGGAVALGAERSANAMISPRSDAELVSIARKRIEGNDPHVAERIAISLLREEFPEPIEKIRVMTVPAASVAGIMLSGSALHGPVIAAQFEADARAMAALTLSNAPGVSEVDVWATVPQAVASGTIVAGDLAAPTERTVFSTVVRRGEPEARAFVDKAWAVQLSVPPAP
jgi:peptidoglycan/xylan/chitin deacetylase (PgdA/CDA1 family)